MNCFTSNHEDHNLVWQSKFYRTEVVGNPVGPRCRQRRCDDPKLNKSLISIDKIVKNRVSQCMS